MELARGFRSKDLKKINRFQNGRIGLNPDNLLVIKLPDSRAMRVLSHSLFLAIVILTLPFMGSIVRELNSSSYYNVSGYGLGSASIDFEFMGMLLQDLAKEGLIKKVDKALVVSSGVGAVIDSSRSLNANEILLVSKSELEQESLFPNATVDFVLTLQAEDSKFVNRIVKVGGIVITELGNDLSNALQEHSNYKIVYLRQYDSTIVAMRKMSAVNQFLGSPGKRRPLQLALDAKKTVLQGLEDVLFEPPRKALGKSRTYLKKFKYLPDLLGDPLEDHSRLVFINVGVQEEKNDDAMEWFNKNYPTRNQNFEFCNVIPGSVASSVDVSNWLMKDVRGDEFVVMKAEAEVVVELIKRKTIGLVDELFLECNNQWQMGQQVKSKRAYWECVALYGRVRDEGVAVHQWWD